MPAPGSSLRSARLQRFAARASALRASLLSLARNSRGLACKADELRAQPFFPCERGRGTLRARQKGWRPEFRGLRARQKGLRPEWGGLRSRLGRLARKVKRLATGVGRLARKVREACVQGKKSGGRNSEACAQGKNACDRVSEAARKGREAVKPTDPRFAVIAIEGLTIVGLTRGVYSSHAFIFQPSSRRTPGSSPQRTHTMATPAALGVPALHTRSLRRMGPGLRRDDDLWGGWAPPPRHSTHASIAGPSSRQMPSARTVATPAALGVPTLHTRSLRRMGPGLRRDDDLWGGWAPPPRHSTHASVAGPSSRQMPSARTVATPAALGVPTRHTLSLRSMGPGLRRDDDLWDGRAPPPRHSTHASIARPSSRQMPSAHGGRARCFGRTHAPHTFSPEHGSRPAPG